MNAFAMIRRANEARDAEWRKGAAAGFTLSFRGNELAGETGEACNVLKKLDRERMGLVGSRATLEQAAEELADVVICVDLAAMDLGIDLLPAIVAKFNATSEARGLATRLSMSAASSDVLAERHRHVEAEGWSAEHDDRHGRGEIVQAALNYAAAAIGARALNRESAEMAPPLDGCGPRLAWPWAPAWWKPGTPRRMLVKAAALIIAEIERIDRLASRAEGREAS